jgi:O-succinylbenzoic acid--CoA ligase
MDWLAAAASAQSDSPAVIAADRTVSYGELDMAANGVAAIISSSGLGSSAVAFWGDRSIEAIAAIWGIPRAGVTAVPVDPSMAPAEAMRLTVAAGVRGLWTTPDGGFDRLVARGRDRLEPVDRPEVPYIVFTSGSQARPKGVLLTDVNIEAAVKASRNRLHNGSADPWLCVLPLFHVGGLSIPWRQAESGGAVVLLERFDAAAAGAALDRVAFASLVPVMLHRLLETGKEWSSLDTVLVGGAASDRLVLEKARAAGIPAVPTYGMTEMCSQVATASAAEPLDGSVGMALSGAEIRVTVDGASVVGIEGQIEVRGEMLSPGYLDEPGRIPGEWFVTGDVGAVDSDGRLTVAGRTDQIIVTGGENVHPAMVERLLATNPAIRAARVFGQPDPEWGMLVAAEVETDEPVASLEEWAEGRLSESMRPRRWYVVDRVEGKLDA